MARRINLSTPRRRRRKPLIQRPVHSRGSTRRSPVQGETSREKKRPESDFSVKTPRKLVGTRPIPCPSVRRRQITPRRSILNFQRHAHRHIQGARPLRCGWLDRQLCSMQDELDRAVHHRRPCGSPLASADRGKIIFWRVPENVEPAVVPFD